MPQYVIITDPAPGMNSVDSPRKLGTLVEESGEFTGAFPLLKNVSRVNGTFAPRGRAQKVPFAAGSTGQEGTKVLVGEPVALQVNTPFLNMTQHPNETYDAVNNEWNPDEDELHSESLLYITHWGNYASLRFATVTSDVTADLETQTFIDATWTSSYPNWNLLYLDPGHTLAYDSNPETSYAHTRLLKTYNIHRYPVDYSILEDVTWSLTGAVITVTDSADVGVYHTWRTITHRFENCYAKFYRTDTNAWMDEVRISYVTATPAGITIHLTASTGLTNVPLSTVYCDIYSSDILNITPYAVAPTVTDFAVSGDLIGTYQYATSYGTITGEESNLSPWSTTLTVTSSKILVSMLPLAAATTLAETIDRVHIYRRGGTLGSTAIRVSTLYIPWKCSPVYDSEYMYTHTRAAISSTEQYIGVYASTLTNWPAKGTARFMDMATWTAGEEILYNSIQWPTALTPYFSLCTRGYGGTTATTQAANNMLFSDCIVDNTADSALGTQYPSSDHAPPPYDVKFAVTTGTRLALVSAATPASVYISSTESWRYFQDPDNLSTNYLTDATTGQIVPIGSGNTPVTGMELFGTDTIVVFKENEAYALTCSDSDFPSVSKLPGIDGSSNPGTIITFKNYLSWVHGKQVWLYDGSSLLVDIAKNISEFHDTTLKDDATAKYAMKTIFYDNKLVLFYTASGDTNYNTRYIEWDWNQVYEYADEVYLPTATIGDEYEARCVAVSTSRPDTPVIYGTRNDAPHTTSGYYASLYRLFNRIPYGASGTLETNSSAYMIIQTPDFSGGSVFYQPRIDKLAMVWSSTGAMTTANITVTPILGSIVATEESGTMYDTYALADTTTDRPTRLQIIANKMDTSKFRTCHFVGVEIKAKLDDLIDSATSQFYLERIEIHTVLARHDSQEVSDGWS